MKCIDFDKEFQRYMTAWLKEHSKEYKNMDAVEAKIADIYQEFLEKEASWLGGLCPGDYFEQYDNAKQLVNHMEDYYKQRIPVPDMLLNRITELRLEAEEPLMALLTKERAPAEARMTAVEMLREIESVKPLPLYIEWIKNRSGREDELADNALESLEDMGEAAVQAMRAALSEANDAGAFAFCSLLCHYGDSDEQVLSVMLRLFETHAEYRAELADYLGKLGNEKALDILKKTAASEETGYLDYIELRNAIERLGGDAPEREFDAEDPAWNAMRGMQ